MKIDSGIEQLLTFIEENNPLFVLTGAGCSTDSGIPDYREKDGNWKHSQPVQYNDFVGDEAVRKRYWARSMTGWPRVATANPNPAHDALARLEKAGYIHQLVTQNVDGLHQRAGSKQVIELHGQLQTVSCLDCGHKRSRTEIQEFLTENNPCYQGEDSPIKPDGDAVVDRDDYSSFLVPECLRCGGTLKPDVVFFGESVPRGRVDTAMDNLKQTKGMLTVGSSLMVFSGYRFCRAAKEQEIPCAALNLGRTRADGELTLKVESSCSPALSTIIEQLNC